MSQKRLSIAYGNGIKWYVPERCSYGKVKVTKGTALHNGTLQRTVFMAPNVN
jgi:hypothetical protein